MIVFSAHGRIRWITHAYLFIEINLHINKIFIRFTTSKSTYIAIVRSRVVLKRVEKITLKDLKVSYAQSQTTAHLWLKLQKYSHLLIDS